MTLRRRLKLALREPKASARSETALLIDAAGRKLRALADRIEYGS